MLEAIYCHLKHIIGVKEQYIAYDYNSISHLTMEEVINKVEENRPKL